MVAMEDELTPAIIAARERLRQRFAAAAQQQQLQLGGKGTARRKARKVHKSVVGDDKKLQQTLKRLAVTSIFGVEEVYLLRADGTALHLANPKVQAAPTANTYVISGSAEERSGLSALASLKSAGAALQAGSASAAAAAAAALEPAMLKQLQQHVESLSKKDKQRIVEEGDTKDDVPDLVDNFEEASKQ